MAKERCIFLYRGGQNDDFIETETFCRAYNEVDQPQKKLKSLKFHAGVQKLKPFTCTDCEANFSNLPR